MNTTKKFYVQPTIIVHEIQNHLMDNALSVPNPNQNGNFNDEGKIDLPDSFTFDIDLSL